MLVVVYSVVSIQTAWSFKGEVLQVPLQQQTQVFMKIVPNLGTRLIFPFILDDPQLKPPLNYKLTNTRDFEVARKLDSIAGQNVFLITASGKTGAIGKLYISIAGYNLALNLVASHKIDDHISDVYFNLSEDDRNFLINQEIARTKDFLEKSYQNRLDSRSKLSDDLAMAAVMNYGLSKKNIKMMARGGKDKFKQADIFLDKFLYLKPYIYAINFWVQHYGKKFTISSMLVQSQNKDGSSTIVEGNLQCFDDTKKLDKCLFITDNPVMVFDSTKLTITLTNDNDEIFIINY